ncbi:unnamed protein product [Phytomonas sp. Hart1]|nr:unnamed protein product [Phytomonas sp. Hart1]|eukprot:CCW71580.1 unnamed protein product [Phytomonas sp. isolate Hart1]
MGAAVKDRPWYKWNKSEGMAHPPSIKAVSLNSLQRHPFGTPSRSFSLSLSSRYRFTVCIPPFLERIENAEVRFANTQAIKSPRGYQNCVNRRSSKLHFSP